MILPRGGIDAEDRHSQRSTRHSTLPIEALQLQFYRRFSDCLHYILVYLQIPFTASTATWSLGSSLTLRGAIGGLKPMRQHEKTVRKHIYVHQVTELQDFYTWLSPSLGQGSSYSGKLFWKQNIISRLVFRSFTLDLVDFSLPTPVGTLCAFLWGNTTGRPCLPSKTRQQNHHPAYSNWDRGSSPRDQAKSVAITEVKQRSVWSNEWRALSRRPTPRQGLRSATVVLTTLFNSDSFLLLHINLHVVLIKYVCRKKQHDLCI